MVRKGYTYGIIDRAMRYKGCSDQHAQVRLLCWHTGQFKAGRSLAVGLRLDALTLRVQGGFKQPLERLIMKPMKCRLAAGLAGECCLAKACNSLHKLVSAVLSCSQLSLCHFACKSRIEFWITQMPTFWGPRLRYVKHCRVD